MTVHADQNQTVWSAARGGSIWVTFGTVTLFVNPGNVEVIREFTNALTLAADYAEQANRPDKTNPDVSIHLYEKGENNG
jgi:hypothetical protein